MRKRSKSQQREIRIRVAKGTRKDKNWLRRSFLNALIDLNRLKAKDMIVEAAEIYWSPLICVESDAIKISRDTLNVICLTSINKLQERIEIIREIRENLIQDEGEVKSESKEIDF
jgi:hypothetical protein